MAWIAAFIVALLTAGTINVLVCIAYTASDLRSEAAAKRAQRREALGQHVRGEDTLGVRREASGQVWGR